MSFLTSVSEGVFSRSGSIFHQFWDGFWMRFGPGAGSALMPNSVDLFFQKHVKKYSKTDVNSIFNMLESEDPLKDKE